MSTNSHFIMKPMAAAIAALSLSTPGAFAQSGDGISEIVITAQFREENLQETPLAVTAVDDEMMRARGMEDVSSVAQQAPNVQIKQSSGPYGGSASAFIRGVGQEDFNFALEPGVGMYIDDVYYPTMTGSNFETVDLERIEILRGPQGTLQGRNSIGGAVRLITKKPSEDNTGYIQLNTGKFDRTGGRAAGDLTLTEDMFLRVSLAGENRDGYVDRIDYACENPEHAAQLNIGSQSDGLGCNLGTLGGRSYFSGRANLVWYATDNLEVNVSVDKTNEDNQAAAMVPLVTQSGTNVGEPGQYGPWFETPEGEYTTYETFNDPESPVTGEPFSTEPVNNLMTSGYAVTLDYQINPDMNLKYISSRRELENDFATAYDGSPLNGETGWLELSGHSWQNELRLNGTAGDVDYTLGLFHFTQENTNSNRVSIGYQAFPFDFVSYEVADSESQAAFAHAVWRATDRMKVTAGIRYSDERKDQLLARLSPTDGGQSGSDLPSFASLPEDGYAPVETFETDRFDYRLSLDYQWNEDVLTYATYSTGYKSGGVSPRFFHANHIQPFGVEEMDNYELGLKGDFLDRNLRVNAAVFYNEYTDQQTTAPGNICPDLTPQAPCLVIGNYVDSDMWGWEFEANWLPTDNTTIDLSVSSLNMDYSRISPVTLQNPNFVADPDAPPNVAGMKGSLGIQHAFYMEDGSSLTPRVDIISEAARKSDLTNTLNVPSFTIANLSVAWRSPNEEWEVIGRVNNVTDEYYFVNVFDQTPAAGFASGQLATPRTWAVSVRRDFF